jgi:hypothetical protein
MIDSSAIEPEVVLDEASIPFEPFPSERPIGPDAPRSDSPIRLRLASRSRRRVAPILPSAPALFPWLARRFAPGEATLWTGPSLAVEPILEMLYAGSALARGRISLLEGANRFHPYRVGELGRSLGVDATETLRSIRLARAFTAYQMVALVEGWAREARRHPPTLLVGHDLPTLFTADEVPDDEREALLRHIARTLRDLLEEHAVPLLLTLVPGGLSRFPGLANDGPRWCDLVTFDRGPVGLRAHALRDGARLALVPRLAGQEGLDAFDGGPATEEVIAWDVPPRHTVRRSRSG